MDREGLISIEISALAAALVLALRLFSLLGARGALERQEKVARDALSTGDPQAIRAAIRRLAARVPYGDWTSELLAATENADKTQRKETLARAAAAARRRIRRVTSRGLALDWVVLAVTLGLGAFAREALRVGPLVLGLGAVIIVTLVASLLARAALGRSVLAALAQVESQLVERSLDVETLALSETQCPWCGAETRSRPASLRFEENGSEENDADVEISLVGCPQCGKAHVSLDPRLFV